MSPIWSMAVPKDAERHWDVKSHPLYWSMVIQCGLLT